ncbi:hypothetical protein GH714_017438 [Hevea brasiliensis]|uniref:FAR1 domain-containing protein n=1 Tax=Hevea brasiliensis TaxID=3981 RepID=A0A6A6ME96_HEVBR|nr:hypothetical protein GH714_017438 [Hevea brasiliensis]
MQESQSGSDGQRSNIHEDEIAYNVEEGPKSGMHFPTMDNLVNFYKEHARLKGFSIVMRSSSKGNGSVPKYVLMTYDKGNKPHGGKYTKRLRVLKVNLSEWNDGLLASAVGSENVGVANSDSSVAILNPLEARSSGRPRSNRFRSRRELNGGSNRGRSRCRRGRRGHDTSVGGGGQMTNIITQNNSLQENAHGYPSTSINHTGEGMQMSQHQSITRIGSDFTCENLNLTL